MATTGGSDIKTRPFINYNGQISYCLDMFDCAFICDKILNQAIMSPTVLVLGFDTEWPVFYPDGPGKTALIQISPSLEQCYLLQVSYLKKLPKALTELLSHPNVRLTGVNIKNDINKMARDFPGINKDKIIENCIDLRTLANTVLDSKQWSLEKLVNHFFNLQLDKDKKIRKSRWNKFPLSNVQKQYAATDAYVSLKLYLHLSELKQ